MISAEINSQTRLQNRMLTAFDKEDFQLLAPRLTPVTLEKGALLYDPGDLVDAVYFPDDCVISLMTLMESGAAIESATIGREGALGLMAAVSPRQSLSRAGFHQSHQRDDAIVREVDRIDQIARIIEQRALLKRDGGQTGDQKLEVFCVERREKAVLRRSVNIRMICGHAPTSEMFGAQKAVGAM